MFGVLHQNRREAWGPLLQLLFAEYMERGFISTKPPEELKDDGIRLRRARDRVYAKYPKVKDPPESTSGFFEELEALTSLANDRENQPAENRVAFELSVALETLGAAVYTGVIPHEITLAIASDQIVDDWCLAVCFARKYRSQEGAIAFDGGKEIPYHRRHAEWLALLSALWLRKYFPKYKSLRRIELMYTDSAHENGWSNLERIFAQYTEYEKKLMPLAWRIQLWHLRLKLGV